MEDIFFVLLGLFMAYVWSHFLVVQFTKTWNDRSGYERFLTIFSIVMFVFYLIGSTS